jgi:hypothetical protein
MNIKKLYDIQFTFLRICNQIGLKAETEFMNMDEVLMLNNSNLINEKRNEIPSNKRLKNQT